MMYELLAKGLYKYERVVTKDNPIFEKVKQQVEVSQPLMVLPLCNETIPTTNDDSSWEISV